MRPDQLDFAPKPLLDLKTVRRHLREATHDLSDDHAISIGPGWIFVEELRFLLRHLPDQAPEPHPVCSAYQAMVLGDTCCICGHDYAEHVK